MEHGLHRGRLDRVEMMRGVAALCVVVAHAVDVTEGMGPRVSGQFVPAIPAANDFGASGVDLFFVISGFVMAHLIAGAPPSPGAFVRRRIHRIVPLFLLTSIAYAALLATTGWRPTVGAIANTLTLLPVIDGATYSVPPLFVGWTLAFEAGFYLLVLLVLASGVARRREALFVVAVAAAALGMVVYPAWMALRIVLNPIMAEFALGVAAHLCWERGMVGAGARRVLIALLTVFVVATAVRPIDLSFSVHFAEVIDGSSGTWRTLVWGVPWALVLIGALGPTVREAVWQKRLRRVGTASYALYLSHPVVMLVAPWCLPAGCVVNVYLMVATLVAASVLLALAVHRFVERPLLAWAVVPRGPAMAVA